VSIREHTYLAAPVARVEHAEERDGMRLEKADACVSICTFVLVKASTFVLVHASNSVP
jgi:hypothetical protein